MFEQVLRYYNSAKIFRFFINHKYIYKSILRDLYEKWFHSSLYTKPRNIVLKLHSACNANCRFCYAQKDLKLKTGLLSVEEWKKVIDQAKKLGCYTVTLSGGEPLIYPQLIDLIMYIKSKKMLAFTTTNGIVINHDIIKKMEKAGLCAINFSLYGPSDYHDWLTGVRGSFDKIVKYGEYCAKKTNIICIVNHVVTKESIKNKLYEFVWELMKGKGFRALNLLPICVSSPDKSDLLDIDELQLFDKLAKKPYVLMDTKNYSKLMCPAGREDLFVNDYGGVQPCPFLPISFGNIRHESLKNIFLKIQNHKMFREERNICMPARDHEFIDDYIIPTFKTGKLPVTIKDLKKDQ